MTTAAPARLNVPSISLEHLAHERTLQACQRALHGPGWESRLQPLATHMAAKCLVRARGHAGAPLRHLDLELLHVALSRLLSQGDGDGLLIVQLVVEGKDPAVAARERGVSRPAPVDLLRDAVDELAVEYEDTAYASVGESKQERVRATLRGKRG
jgi:hypothetical protein